MKRAPLAALAALALAAPAARGAGYAAFELPLTDGRETVAFEDMDGDGTRDLVAARHRPGLGRELRIHHQRPGGGFEAVPRTIEIKTEVVAAAFADLRDGPGRELLLLTGGGVFSLSAAAEGYAGNVRLLFEWPLAAAVPDRERLPFADVVSDVNGDGLPDLLLPGDDRHGLFLGRGGEAFELAFVFSTLDEDLTPLARARSDAGVDARLGIDARRGVVLELDAAAPSPFEGFVAPWRDGPADGELLRAERWMPAAALARLDGDELPDIAYVDAGSGRSRLNIHYQRPDGGFGAAPDWRGELDPRGELELADLNGDGRADLMRLSGRGGRRDARLFLNRDGAFELGRPDQILRFPGYGASVEVIPLGAGRAALGAVYHTVPAAETLRGAGVDRVRLLYDGDGPVFGRRPAARLEERFSADAARALAGRSSLRFDVDGDGRPDAMQVTADGALTARRIGEDLQVAREPFWEYVPRRAVLGFEVLSLNGDALPDLVLRHGAALTVLVARP